jgi:hypothetical protein
MLAAFFLLRWAVMGRQWFASSLQRRDTSELWEHGISLALYLLAIAVAFYKPWFSLLITGLVTVVWVIPEAGVKEPPKTARAQSTPME